MKTRQPTIPEKAMFEKRNTEFRAKFPEFNLAKDAALKFTGNITGVNLSYEEAQALRRQVPQLDIFIQNLSV